MGCGCVCCDSYVVAYERLAPAEQDGVGVGRDVCYPDVRSERGPTVSGLRVEDVHEMVGRVESAVVEIGA